MPSSRKPNAQQKGPKQRGPQKKGRRSAPGKDDIAVDLRIIGGKYRGTKLVYEPFLQLGRKAEEGPEAVVTRPMKHRVREAIFNLVGIESEGRLALDIFAGTGALGLEALSRGAACATFIERHIPTVNVIKQNIAAIRCEDCCTLLRTSTFLWSKRDLPTFAADLQPPAAGIPWVIFISPPYDFFIERQQEMLDLIEALLEHSPAESTLVIEADERFDFNLLPGTVMETRYDDGWDVRKYAPAMVGVWRKP